MENMFYINSYKTKIEDKDFYRIAILDLNHTQLFFIYKIIDSKTTQFINSHKTFDNVSDKLTFVIKTNNKISLDIK